MHTEFLNPLLALQQGYAIKAGGPGSGRHPGMGMHLATPIHVDGGGWKQTGGAKGSNPGGFYTNPGNGKSYYVKFPQGNQEQSNAEVLADKIYEHLGLPAKNSMLVTNAAKDIGVASPIIPAVPMSKADMAAHSHVLAGYVADAYLANWDVFGLGHDNIIKSTETGAAHRIDNGGALNFRAQGAEKPFPKDAVLELTSLRQPGKQGAEIWKDLGPKDERAQAAHLVNKMTDQKITQLISSAGYTGSKASDMYAALQGRRDVIKTKYNL